MSSTDEQFLKNLRATFKVEAGEHLQTISAGLLALEKAPDPAAQRQLLETVFRAAHSLKGAARAVNFIEIESTCQSLEDAFASWKRLPNKPTPEALDRVHRSLDAVTGVLVPKPAIPPFAPPTRIEPGTSVLPRETSLTDKAGQGDTVRISVEKLDTQLLEAEEMLTAKLLTAQRVTDLRALEEQLQDWRTEWSLVQPELRNFRRTIERAESLPDQPFRPGWNRLIEFFDWSHDYFRTLEGKVSSLHRTAGQDYLAVSKLVDDLLADSKKLLMVPLSTLGASFPRMVRDLCRDQGKEADLVIQGGELEIDKRILEEMKDPLIHILRNCIDHGIETPEQRHVLGKPRRATINITISPLSTDKVELLVRDDGTGIDSAKVKASALRHALISGAEALTMNETELLALIFQAEVSTQPVITQLSGRGLGLAIVREKTEKLGGRVTVESRLQVGTTIRITLPVTMATFRGILVEAADRCFVIPTAQVERVTRFNPADMGTVEGQETISLGGRTLSLVRLADVLELPPLERPAAPSPATTVVILGTGDHRIAFAVDAVLDEQEVLVKRLSPPLSRVRNIAAATVLGSGKVAPILNVADLLKSARKAAGRPARVAASSKPPANGRKSILVVEDSITSRMLLKGILESAGHKVTTAVDGLDAYATLRSERFDVVVSDVEMPRLNGFDLTTRIRADRKLSELPVILVTALGTPEDRERGIDAGANAYLVKGSLDQSNLLEAIRRLV